MSQSTRTRITTAKAQPAASALQRKPVRAVNQPGDRFEEEADRMAAAVMHPAHSGGAVPLALDQIPITQLQRKPRESDEERAKQADEARQQAIPASEAGKQRQQENETFDAAADKTAEAKANPGEQSDDPNSAQYKKAAGKLGEAFLETPMGKDLLEKAKALGTPFWETLYGKIVTGAVATASVAALAKAHAPLPVGIPEINLDKLAKGLTAKITYEGPVDKPTKAMITFSLPLGRVTDRPKLRGTERIRAENAQMRAEQERFRQGMRVKPGSAEERQQKAEETAVYRAAQGRSQFNVADIVKTYPYLQQRQPEERQLFTPPRYGFKPRWLLGDQYRLPPPLLPDRPMAFSAEQIPDVERTAEQSAHEAKQQQDERPIMRKAADHVPAMPTPPAVHAAAVSGGQPLDPGTRRFMERRFGRSFGDVRIHVDGNAARAVDAQAYTVGRDIVFDTGQYSPETTAGRTLLAHELTHVVQQRGALSSGARPSLQRKGTKKSAAQPFHQETIDALEKTKKSMPRLMSGGLVDILGELPPIKKLVAFTEAIDKEQVKEIPKLLTAFLTSETKRLPFGVPSDPLVNTIIGRLLLLGLEAESEKFRTWYLKHERETYARRDGTRHEYTSELFIWDNVLEQLSAAIPEKGADQARKAMDALLLFFVQVRDEIARLDPEEIKADRKRRAEFMAMDLGFSWLTTERSISVYHGQLIQRLQETFVAIQAAYQVLLDEAVADLAANKGSEKLVIAKARLENRLRPAIEPDPTKDPKAREKSSGAVAVETTKSKFDKKQSQHLDFFAKGKAAGKRTVDINFYDATMATELAAEKQASFARIFQIRRDQISVIERLYGLAKDPKSGQITGESKENLEIIRKMGQGGLRLESNEDWRQFVLAKYTAQAAQVGKAKALSNVMRLLELYLHTFTVHTPYNIDDFGDNLLTKQFPRALTGQLIHDCGVYALRIAYILSLVREHKDLQLQFQYILLPVHIGLIITGKDLPLFIAHNDSFSIYSPQQLALLQQDWKKIDRQGQELRAPHSEGEAQFRGELAAGEFIPGADLPFKTIDVPKPGKTGATTTAALWKSYRGPVAAAQEQLFGPEIRDPKSPHYQFHLRYLKVLDMLKLHHNSHVLPFWNVTARAIWAKHENGLKAALDALKAAPADKRSKAGQDYVTAVERYEKELMAALAAVKKSYQPIQDEQKALREYVNQHPQVIGDKAQLAAGARIDALFGAVAGWDREVEQHIDDLFMRNGIRSPFAADQPRRNPID